MHQPITLSVIIPGIRPEHWLRCYERIISAGSSLNNIEIIFVGPYDLPNELKNHTNVRFIKDFGSPVRCQQIALGEAKGKYIATSADDAWHLDESINRVMDILYANDDYKTIVTCKYMEGLPGRKEYNWKKRMSKDCYWYINHHKDLRSDYIPDDYFLLANAFISKSYIVELGGWDCRFMCTGTCSFDLGIRAQHDGAKFILTDFPVLSVDWEHPHLGDHVPMHRAWLENDRPFYRTLYSDPDWVERIRIDQDNWKDQPEVWDFRFTDGADVPGELPIEAKSKN